MLHLDILETYIEPMDISATTFVDEMTRDQAAKDTSVVLAKCTRMTFEIICKCLMGEFDNETQTSTSSDVVFDAISVLAKTIIWRVKNFLIVKILQFIPFGDTIFGPLFPVLVAEKTAMKRRDEYIANRMSVARSKIENGEDSADLATLLVKERTKDGEPMFTVRVQ